MARRKALFNSVDLRRAIAVAKKAGLTISQTEITPDGKFVLVYANVNPDQISVDPDAALANWKASRR